MKKNRSDLGGAEFVEEMVNGTRWLLDDDDRQQMRFLVHQRMSIFEIQNHQHLWILTKHPMAELAIDDRAMVWATGRSYHLQSQTPSHCYCCARNFSAERPPALYGLGYPRECCNVGLAFLLCASCVSQHFDPSDADPGRWVWSMLLGYVDPSWHAPGIPIRSMPFYSPQWPDCAAILLSYNMTSWRGPDYLDRLMCQLADASRKPTIGLVLRHYYGIDGGPRLPLREIAKEVGVGPRVLARLANRVLDRAQKMGRDIEWGVQHRLKRALDFEGDERRWIRDQAIARARFLSRAPKAPLPRLGEARP